MINPSTELLTIIELSKTIKVKVATIYFWVHQNKIPHTKFGKHLRFDLEEVQAFFKLKTSEQKLTCQLNISKLTQRPKQTRSLKIKDVDHFDPPKKEN